MELRQISSAPLQAQVAGGSRPVLDVGGGCITLVKMAMRRNVLYW